MLDDDIHAEEKNSTRASAESPGVWFSDSVTTFPHIVSLDTRFSQNGALRSQYQVSYDTMCLNDQVTMSENHTPGFSHEEEAPLRLLE